MSSAIDLDNAVIPSFAAFLEVQRRRLAYEKGAVQVHFKHSIPLIRAHLVEKAIAQDACIIHHAVDAPKGGDSAFDDALRACRFRDAVDVGDRLAAGLPYFIDHLLRRAAVLALSGQRCADVVDHDLRALRRHRQHNVAADASARACYYNHFSFQHFLNRHDMYTLFSCFRPARSSTPRRILIQS
jgi:hypothetical protein